MNDAAADVAELKKQIGRLKTENSTLKSELGYYQKDVEDSLLTYAAEYLKKEGASVVVIGGIAIRHYPGERQYNWELAIKWVGTPPPEKEEQ